MLPYDYYRDKPDDTVGLARTATLIAAARAEAKNALLFDNGDLIQGSPMGDCVAYKRGMKAGDVHPMFAGMNTLDYTCATLGNHEFNYGLSFLGFSLAGAKFPFVCANLVKADGTPLVKPWIVFDKEVVDEAGGKQRLRVGVIGFVPPQIMQWDQGQPGRQGDDAATSWSAAQRHVPELRRQCDMLVALCHSGIEGGERKGGEENAALHLAEGARHRRDLHGASAQGVPRQGFRRHPRRRRREGHAARRARRHGRLLGQPSRHHRPRPRQDGRRLDESRTTGRGPPDLRAQGPQRGSPRRDARPDVVEAVKADHEGTLAYVRQPVGETKNPINSFFALVADDPSVQIVSKAQIWYVAQLAATDPALKGLPVLSAAAPFKAGGRGGPDYYTDVKAGPIAIKDVADIYLYPNTVRAVKISGAEVREWLERSAGLFNRIDPAQDRPSSR